MRKFDKARIIKNVSSNWLSLGINIVVGIVLSPFILHRLGDAAFGIWVLIFSITGYYGLFDLGIRSSLVRYVSKFTAVDDIQGLAKLINTSLFIYTCTGILSMLVTVVLSYYVDRIFHIPPEFYSSARWLLLMVGAAVAVGFPLGIVNGFLEGLQRYYILSWTNIVTTLLRAAMIVIALNRGRGLLTVAFITVLLPVLSSIVRGVVAFQICPVPLSFQYVDRATLKTMAHYSSVTFAIMIATQLKFKSDEIVIGAMMSAAAIAYFNIGARIVDYAGMVVTTLAQIFVPMSSQSEATGDMAGLRRILLAGNRVCAFTIFPICALLIILGKSVIEVWMGKKYIDTSYPVLVIMIIPCTLLWCQAASGRILLGTSRHRAWALVTLTEGICNVILSVILVRPFGIVGDAFGTAIPMTCSMLLFMPQHVCRQVGITIADYLREGFFLPLLLCAPFSLTLWLLRYWFIPHNYRQLALQVSIGAAVYGLALLWAGMTKRVLRVDPKALNQASRSAGARLMPVQGQPVQEDI